MACAFDDLDDFEEELDRLDNKAGLEASEVNSSAKSASDRLDSKAGLEASEVNSSAKSASAATAHFQHAARRNISWFHPEAKAWLRTAGNGEWQGWSVEPVARTGDVGEWSPWEQVLDDRDAPFFRWFSGGLTNAAFSEVDIHVLEGRRAELAYIEEPDPQVQGDAQAEITRGALLARSVAAAQILKCNYKLCQGDRVLFYLPAGTEQIIWVEACKRLGLIYCCCNPSLPPEQIADRVAVLDAKLVITAEHPEWSFSVYKALSTFVPVPQAVALASGRLGLAREGLEARWANRCTVSINEPPFKSGELGADDVKGSSLLNAKVLVLGEVKVPLNALQAKILRPASLVESWTLQELQVPKAELRGPDDVAELWKQYGAPVPLEANYPMFVIFTSGTTGKPKGVCHVHGYVAGLVETMRYSFGADPAADRMLTVGALGWITGQSYQISAVLASGVTTVLMRGNPVKPTRCRFAEVVRKHGITIFKAGSAFLREVMTTPQAMESVREISTDSLKVATFCAEPVSESVQAFAQSAICPEYINSYWATEHGGIVWSRRFGDASQPLKADAHSWPLPWVEADVFVFDDAARQGSVGSGAAWRAKPAAMGERADVVCTAPYPYMFRYVWGDVQNFGQEGWTGDRTAMLAKYWRWTQVEGKGESWVYTQGDFAVKYPDGAFTFHGRSDEVLNVNGILFGTEHIEGAILRDKQRSSDSPVGHCVIVGYPDEVAGEVPMAFLTPGDPERKITSKDFIRLFKLVQEIVGPVSVKFVPVSALPQTFSGKFMRRLLTAISRGLPLGDQSTVSNPECIPKLQEEFALWKRGQPSAGK